MTDRRYPLRPLVERAGSTHALGEVLHLSGSTLKVLAVVELTYEQADRYACALGVHPCAVWPSFCDDALTVLDDQFINHGGWRQAWEYDQQRRVSA